MRAVHVAQMQAAAIADSRRTSVKNIYLCESTFLPPVTLLFFLLTHMCLFTIFYLHRQNMKI